MAETAKETVIIVHGTWAAPHPGPSLWYQPVSSAPRTIAGFTARLDAALEERGSPARCWAHCTQDEPIYQWSGKNHWIERTHAASALGDCGQASEGRVALSHRRAQPRRKCRGRGLTANHCCTRFERAAWHNSNIGLSIHGHDVPDIGKG